MESPVPFVLTKCSKCWKEELDLFKPNCQFNPLDVYPQCLLERKLPKFLETEWVFSTNPPV